MYMSVFWFEVFQAVFISDFFLHLFVEDIAEVLNNCKYLSLIVDVRSTIRETSWGGKQGKES